MMLQTKLVLNISHPITLHNIKTPEQPSSFACINRAYLITTKKQSSVNHSSEKGVLSNH